MKLMESSSQRTPPHVHTRANTCRLTRIASARTQPILYAHVLAPHRCQRTYYIIRSFEKTRPCTHQPSPKFAILGPVGLERIRLICRHRDCEVGTTGTSRQLGIAESRIHLNIVYQVTFSDWVVPENEKPARPTVLRTWTT